VTELRTLPLSQIRPSLNARGRVGDVDELALSLKVLGLQKPLIVIPRGDGDGFDILDGHRRHAAAVKAGLREVEAIVRAELGEAGRIQAQLAMETHAKQFDPMSEARALHALMFKHNLSREQISRAVGRPPAWVRDRIALAHLTASEQSQLQDGKLSVTEGLHRLKVRRAEREGGPAPKPPAAPNKPSRAAAYAANGGQAGVMRTPHFTPAHPLAAAAERLCVGHARVLLSVACGPCWEAAIRQDATATAGAS
jgi:ParB/RepB/Spo0J family partition protein